MRAELPWAGAFLGAAGLVAAPLLVYFALHPAHFFLRSQDLWVFDPVRSQGNPLGTFLFNVWDHLLVLGFRGDPNWRRQLRRSAYAEPMGSVLFLARCGHGRVALAKAARLSSAPSLAGGADPAGNAGFR